MPNRTWVKVYCDKWLSGTIRQETPLIRASFVDLITLSGSGRYGDTGSIKLADGVGFTDEQLSKIINIPFDEWLLVKQRLIETDRIIVDDNNVIEIINWHKYQSEYQRQKSYRGKLLPEVTTVSYREKEKEKEKENRIDNYIHRLSISNKTELITYIHSIKEDYPQLDMNVEIDKFTNYWTEGKRKLKSPKTALRNWMEKAVEFRNNGSGKNEANQGTIKHHADVKIRR